jgi:hypothetical protein
VYFELLRSAYLTFVGAAVIIASGLTTAHRERVRRSGVMPGTVAAKV